MAGPIPIYGTRVGPDGRRLVRDANGRDFIFTGPAVNGFDKYDKVGGFDAPSEAAGVAAVQDPRVFGTAHEPPPPPTQAERFDEMAALGQGPQSAPVPPRSSAPAAFARSAAAAALDTAALPVTVPARLYRAAGGRGEALDTVADLSADEALQDATWLATGEESGDYRRSVAAEREQFPNASAAGVALGTTVGGLGLEGLAERGLARGVGALRITAKERALAKAKLAKDREPTFWRLQNADLPLDVNHRSETFSEDDLPVIRHRGSSAVSSLKDLPKAQANLNRAKPIEAIEFSGEEIERGWDGEPVVIPRRELRRLRLNPDVLPQHRALPFGQSVGDMKRAGWVDVPTLDVKGAKPIPGSASSLDAAAPVSGQARGAVREQAQEKQRTYTKSR